MLSTALLRGGICTVNVGDNAKIDISAGEAIFVNNYTDVDNPTVKVITWDAFTGVAITNIATETETYVGIDENGNILQQSDIFDPIDRRDIVPLCVAEHPSHTEVERCVPDTVVGYDVKLQFYDFIEAFGPWNVDGNIYYANGANLNINKTSGETYRAGLGYEQDKRTPNIFMDDPVTAATFLYAWRDAGEPTGWKHGAEVTAIDPEHYDDGSGTLADVGVGKFTIQPIFMESGINGIAVIQYGQVQYDTMDDAESNLLKAIEIDPYVDEAVFRCWLIVQQGTTHLDHPAEAKFVAAGKFGLSTVITGSISGEINTASNVGLSGIGVFLQKLGVDLQFKNINPASNKITVVNNVGNKTVDIDVDPSQIPITGLNSSATPGQMLMADANGCPVDATNTNADVADAVSKKHFRSHAIDGALDHTYGAQGSIPYAGAGGVGAQLAPGTSGQFLKTQGAAANPVWADVLTTGMTIRQILNVRLAADQSTSSMVFVDMPTMSIAIVTIAGSTLKIIFTATGSVNSANKIVAFRLVVDGVPLVPPVSRAFTSTGSGSPDSVAFTSIITGLLAGAHTIKIQWMTTGGTAQCRPVTSPDNEGASFIIEEIK